MGKREGICQNISTDRQGVPEARGGIPRREARYFAICQTLTPNIAIIPEFYKVFVRHYNHYGALPRYGSRWQHCLEEHKMPLGP